MGIIIFPVFSGLSRYQYLRISNIRHWGTFPEGIQTCEPDSRLVSRSFPDQHHAFWVRTVSRSTAGRALLRFIRERQHSGAHGIPGLLILHEQAPSDTNEPYHYV